MCYNYIRYNEIAVKSYFIAVFSDFSGGRFKLKKAIKIYKNTGACLVGGTDAMRLLGRRCKLG